MTVNERRAVQTYCCESDSRWENQEVPTTGKRGEDALIELFLRIYGARSWAGDLSRREYPERVKDSGVEIIATPSVAQLSR